jgi:hypothetical protein
MTPRLALPLLLATTGCFAAEPVHEPWDDPGESDELFSVDVMHELELRLEDDAIASLRASPREWVPGTIVYQGRSFGPVGVRLKGQNSFQPIDEKPSFRVNVDEYVEGVSFYGLHDLTFNNMSSDWSQMHERLAYWVAREAGLPASRANHVVITVNGEPYGLYANVETVKPRMLKAFFDDNDGPLFEATDVDFAPEYVDAYEHDNGPDDRSLLEGLAEALTIADPDDAIAAAREFIDLEHFQTYWAMSSVVGQFDAFPFSLPGDDYYLYADPTTRKLWFIPWGMDETFFAADFSPLQVQSVLARRCMESPACFQGYVDRTWEVLALTEALDLEAERARVQELVTPHIADDRRRPFTDAEITEGQTQLGYFIRGRREVLTGFLPPPSN